MVKRYQPNWNAGTNSHGVHDAVDGEFVRYSDYAALEAQLAERVKVKPLEWIHAKGNLAGQEVWSSGDPWVFWIVKNPNERFVWCESFGLEDHIPASPVRGIFDTLADAKAAAQADFDRRIISALEATPPVPKVTEIVWHRLIDGDPEKTGRYIVGHRGMSAPATYHDDGPIKGWDRSVEAFTHWAIEPRAPDDGTPQLFKTEGSGCGRRH